MQPWDKLPSESDEAHARFLIYRNLGPKRGLKKAYKWYLEKHDGYTGGLDGLHIPGQWHEDCRLNKWVERCTAWDIRNLYAYGGRVVVLHMQAITKIAEKCVRLAHKANPGDDCWPDLLNSIRVISEYLDPEVVRGIQDTFQSRAAIPAGESSGDDGIS